MKNHVELAYLVLLLVTLIINPPVVSNLKKTVLGKFVTDCKTYNLYMICAHYGDPHECEL